MDIFCSTNVRINWITNVNIFFVVVSIGWLRIGTNSTKIYLTLQFIWFHLCFYHQALVKMFYKSLTLNGYFCIKVLSNWNEAGVDTLILKWKYLAVFIGNGVTSIILSNRYTGITSNTEYIKSDRWTHTCEHPDESTIIPFSGVSSRSPVKEKKIPLMKYFMSFTVHHMYHVLASFF